MAETKKDWIELVRMAEGLEEEFRLPRCYNCDMNQDGHCLHFNLDIPEEHEYEYTKCEHWRAAIPF